jgi:hypothetical protein
MSQRFKIGTYRILRNERIECNLSVRSLFNIPDVRQTDINISGGFFIRTFKLFSLGTKYFSNFQLFLAVKMRRQLISQQYEKFDKKKNFSGCCFPLCASVNVSTGIGNIPYSTYRMFVIQRYIHGSRLRHGTAIGNDVSTYVSLLPWQHERQHRSKGN